MATKKPVKKSPKPKAASKSTKKPKTPARHIEAKSAAGTRSFLFGDCIVEQKGGTLTISLPPGPVTIESKSLGSGGVISSAEPLHAASVTIKCAGKAHARADGSDYPPRPRWDGGTKVVFQGGASFGRVLLAQPMLLVRAQVTGVSGLPKGQTLAGDTITFEVDETHAKAREGAVGDPGSGGGGGPHDPYP
ncbi:MAG: hypothetical protein JST92_23475 [Deltaproteobacteria bacterium]|nr:hypothetical protein [Deltaproteobacteria bacterium]